MDDDSVDRLIIPIDGVESLNPEIGSKNDELLECILSTGDMLREPGSAGEALTRVELDIACSSEKLVNLNILMMHVVEKESDLEIFVSDPGHAPSLSVERALEYNFLSGIFDSEVRELDDFMADIQSEIVNARGIITSSGGNQNEYCANMGGKFLGSEESLEQLLNQIREMRMQSAEFLRALLPYNDDRKWDADRDVYVSQNDKPANVHTKIKMQTAEQQRCVLRMLEKSLAHELDLEKKFTELRLIEDELRLRLRTSEQEMFFVEEEAATAWEKFFEVDGVAVFLMEKSKELISQLKTYQFNTNGCTQQETELNLKLQNCTEQLKAECRATNAEPNCEVLMENNAILSEELKVLKESGNTYEKVDTLEKQLRDYEIQLQHALASTESSQEMQGMLYTTIGDMENSIEDLKLKLLKAEGKANSAEDKSVMLSESNADLNEELTFFRRRVKSLEASLHQAEGKKMEAAKGINFRTKIVTGLVVQLANERQRLYKQISSLSEENNALTEKAKEANKYPLIVSSQDSEVKMQGFTSAREAKGSWQVNELSIPKVEDEGRSNNASPGETEAILCDSITDPSTMWTREASLLNLKHLWITILILLISVVVYFFNSF